MGGMLDELILKRQLLHEAARKRKRTLGPHTIEDQQLGEMRKQIQSLSIQIRDLNRAAAAGRAIAELPGLCADAQDLQWVHGREFHGVPFAGRAVHGSFILNHATRKSEGGYVVQLFVNHRHMSGQIGSARIEVDFDQHQCTADLETTLATLVEQIGTTWLDRHAPAPSA